MTQAQPKGLLRRLPTLLLVLALMGCATTAPQVVVRPHQPTPPAPEVTVPVQPDTAASAAARAYYAQVQQALLSQDLLRTDGGGPDTPVTDRMLTDNFVRIALYDEYVRGPVSTVQQQNSSQLRRWVAPVRVGVYFGASVAADRRATDTAQVASYLRRLSGITGHPIRLDNNHPNFQVYFVSEDERRALGPTLRAALPDLTPNDVAGITEMARSTYCIVYAQSQGDSGVYTGAFAVIRSEHPDLLRLSCIQEEIAQALGLPNDSPAARPSIFNDDEEFALLTTQDELMLKMLYNPALRPGMTEAEARPIIQSLAARLLGGES
jgi:hypothetical protein